MSWDDRGVRFLVGCYFFILIYSTNIDILGIGVHNESKNFFEGVCLPWKC